LTENNNLWASNLVIYVIFEASIRKKNFFCNTESNKTMCFSSNIYVFCMSGFLNSVEILAKDGWQQIENNLPVAISESCMVLLNSTTAFLIGGKQNKCIYSSNTYLFNTAANSPKWFKGPKLNLDRKSHSCARIRKDSSSYQFSIIVVGGYNGNYMTSVEMLDEGASEWRHGPDLPSEISDASLVEDPAGGVILVGGQSNNDIHRQTLFRLSNGENDAQWVEMPQKLKVGRSRHTSFLVPDDVISCSLF